VVELRAQGVTWQHIAHALGRSADPKVENQKTVSVWAQRLYTEFTNGAADNKPSTKGTRTPAAARPKGRLPWEMEDMDEAELIRAITDHKITWRREIDGGIEEDVVRGTKPIYAKVNGEVKVVGETQGPWLTTNGKHREILNFHGEAGTRSVYLDNILEVA
jgi:hypothetical protein